MKIAVDVPPLRRGGREELIARLPKGGTGAEIGVWKGAFSTRLLSGTTPVSLHLVDPWVFAAHFPRRWYGGALANDQKAMDDIHREVVKRFANDTRVIIHRLPSSRAAPMFPDGYFDWVYVDGDHSYEAVLQDLRLWYPKIKKGGFLAGDDYPWRDESGQLSVARAVREFVATAPIVAQELLSSQFLILV